ncbi:class I SAM-dependent methyltransferase [Jannaschia aquimarina]|uniref:RsmC protein n=1 Tax=Jannaschia aquimarina TaxID=935700 RepID=A0A0D1DBR2_9RHOB|nr:class I SAM-dependent methyltransferase [Jannaschia aquimarina]KIT17423.1 Ribosomal RNA small subunit methyltransferase C [Jannaschia aquimarina]SNT24060.1 16S rRNA (guanine1207-N2)-methyltransferase [Jannaschia aquimarina]
MRPPHDVSLPDPSACYAYQPIRPVHDAFKESGYEAGADMPDMACAAAIVFAPRARVLAWDLVARACAAIPKGAPVIVDGDKTDGIETLLRDCRKVAEVGEVFSKAHGKVFSFASPGVLDDWHTPSLDADGWQTRPGIFSADGVDPGSALLAETLPPLSGRVCDLGAGWGYLSAKVLAASPGVTALDMVEADRDALDCAEVNVSDPRGRPHWADATTWKGGPYDAVITNPPFHEGRRADPGLGRAFIATAARVLAPKGRLFLVANRHLPYEAALSDAFAETMVRADARGYKVIEAARPRRRA